VTKSIRGLPNKGSSKSAVMAALQEFRKNDVPWRGGRILAGVYDPGEQVYETIKAANADFLTENQLYFNFYPSLLSLEREVVRTMIDLLGGGLEAVGNFSSGGTESIMTALRAARDWARAEKGVTGVPEIVACVTVHPAFHKAAHFLGMKIVVTPFVANDYRADVDAMRAAITPNTIVLVGSAPSYGHGVVDPIPAIGALSREKGILCHVDACVGGVHLSMMSRAGMTVPEFNLSVPGVTSLSVDLHKFGYAAKNASVVLYRDKSIRKYGLWSCAKTTNYAVMNTTVMSSRGGGPLAGAWAGMQALGLEGYIDIVTKVQDATQRLMAHIRQMPEVEILGRPDMCMLAIAVRPDVPTTVFDLDEAMAKRGWRPHTCLSAGGGPASLHFSINASSVPHVDAIAADLRKCVKELIASPVVRDIPSYVARVQRELKKPGLDLMERVGPILGLVPEKGQEKVDFSRASAVLDALPDDDVDEVLVAFLNDLYV
jgi:sphinganine-1-phosphate aldolase